MINKYTHKPISEKEDVTIYVPTNLQRLENAVLKGVVIGEKVARIVVVPICRGVIGVFVGTVGFAVALVIKSVSEIAKPIPKHSEDEIPKISNLNSEYNFYNCDVTINQK